MQLDRSLKIKSILFCNLISVDTKVVVLQHCMAGKGSLHQMFDSVTRNVEYYIPFMIMILEILPINRTEILCRKEQAFFEGSKSSYILGKYNYKYITDMFLK